MKKLLLSLSVFVICLAASAQRNCGTMDNLQRLNQEDPALAARMQLIENQTAAYVAAHQQGQTNTVQSVITIPVVFHVVYSSPAQNISDAQCIAQLNQLNLDYARLNTDASNTPSAFTGVAANTQFQFCLAQRDPNGNTTSGVIHKSTTTSSFSSNDRIKHASTGGDDAWPAANYLNIWSGNLSGGLLGYAQFPGGAAATDGVVLLYSSIGSMAQPGTLSPYNLGRTATHEVGHWLNLRHTWGDANCGDDLVNDTPTQQTSNFGCPSFPHLTCGNTTTGDMFMNYMDYTDDGCMNIFTAGQTARMQAIFATGGARVGILSSPGCSPPSGTSCGLPTVQATTAISSSSATLNWTAVTGASGYNIQYRISGTGTWLPATSSTNSKTLSGLTASSTYEWQVQTVCGSALSAFTSSATFNTTALSCGVPTGLSAGTPGTTSAVLSWASVTGAIGYSLQWKATSASAWSTVVPSGTSYNLGGLTACTSYQFQVRDTCQYGSSAYSTPFTFTTTGCAVTYCVSKGSNTSYEYINKVTLGSINNASGNNSGYHDYTSLSTTIGGSTAQTITLTSGFTGSAYREYWNVWIDYNHNGSFADPGEKVAAGNSTGALSLTFTVPASALNGSTRMRVQMQYNSAPATSCTSYTYGEVEDYTVIVTGNPLREAADAFSSMSEVLIYPNPATHFVNLAYRATAGEKVTIRISDLLGKVIRVQEIVAEESGLNQTGIEVSDAVRGIYLVEVTAASGSRIVKKLILDN